MKRAVFSAVLTAISLAPGMAVAKDHIVKIVSDYENLQFYFSPRSIEVQPGDSITWVNEAAEEHNVMLYPGGYPKGAEYFASEYLQTAGETFSVTLTQVGTYQYHCLPHLLMGMNGEVVVGRHSTPEEFHDPTAQETKQYRDALLEWFDEDDNLMQVRLHDKKRDDEVAAPTE